MATELPRIISVDDHVIEPAHLFATWLPQKYRDRGPQPLTAGIGELAYVAGKYQITMDPDGPPTSRERRAARSPGCAPTRRLDRPT